MSCPLKLVLKVDDCCRGWRDEEVAIQVLHQVELASPRFAAHPKVDLLHLKCPHRPTISSAPFSSVANLQQTTILLLLDQLQVLLEEQRHSLHLRHQILGFQP